MVLRVLRRVDLASGKPHVTVRPLPGSGDTDANVSQAEALRRERMRLRDTGITQVIRPEKADVAVIPLAWRLVHPPRRTPRRSNRSPRRRPRKSIRSLPRTAQKSTFVRDDEFTCSILPRKRNPTDPRAGNGVSHAVAEFIGKRKWIDFPASGGRPTAPRIAYQETDERHIPLYPIVHQGGDAWTVEHHRYPFAGKENAKVKLGIVAATGRPDALARHRRPEERGLSRARDRESPTSLLVQLLSRDQRSLKLVRFQLGDR